MPAVSLTFPSRVEEPVSKPTHVLSERRFLLIFFETTTSKPTTSCFVMVVRQGALPGY